MDGINFTPAAPNLNFTAGIGVRAPEQQQEAKAQRIPETAPTDDRANLINRDPDEARFEAVREAARNYVQNTFVVSDSRFTIYKQFQENQYIYVTRVTSLRDGKVTVIPESAMMTSLSSGSGRILQASV